jgi:hypothetical protein
VIRSEGGRIIRNQRALRGADLSHEFQEIGIRVTFNVEFDMGKPFENGGEFVHIRSPDVPLVRAGMHGDTVSSRGDALLCGSDNARDPVVPRIAKKSNLVDVDAEPGP